MLAVQAGPVGLDRLRAGRRRRLRERGAHAGQDGDRADRQQRACAPQQRPAHSRPAHSAMSHALTAMPSTAAATVDQYRTRIHDGAS